MTAVVDTRSAYAEACASVGCRPNRTLAKALTKCALDQVNTLDLNTNVVGRNGAIAVVELAARLSSLRRLLLADNNLINDNVLLITKRLLSHPSLIELDLSENPISHAGGKALLAFAKTNRRLRCVRLTGTLINPALIRLIHDACEKNAATHVAEQSTVQAEPNKPQLVNQEPVETGSAPFSVLGALSDLVPIDAASVRCLMLSGGFAVPIPNAPLLAELQLATVAVRTPTAALNALWRSCVRVSNDERHQQLCAEHEYAKTGPIPFSVLGALSDLVPIDTASVRCLMLSGGFAVPIPNAPLLAELQLATVAVRSPTAALNALWRSCASVSNDEGHAQFTISDLLASAEGICVGLELLVAAEARTEAQPEVHQPWHDSGKSVAYQILPHVSAAPWTVRDFPAVRLLLAAASAKSRREYDSLAVVLDESTEDQAALGLLTSVMQ
jgi:hypothetical protein